MLSAFFGFSFFLRRKIKTTNRRSGNYLFLFKIKPVRPVPESNIPRTYATLRTISDKLTSSLYEKYPEIKSQFPFRGFHLFESDTINAFMFKVSQQKASGFKVALSSGLLRWLLASDSRPMDSLSAVFAHEIAHAIDIYDKHGIEQKDKLASQAVEARTDSEAIELLRLAGLPTDSLTRLMGSMNQLESRQRSSLLSPLLSSHPDPLFRGGLTAVRATLLRYQTGAQPLSMENVDLKAMSEELKFKNLFFAKHFHLDKIKSYADFVHGTYAFWNGRARPDEFFPITESQFNILLLIFDHLALNSPPDLDVSTYSDFKRSLAMILGLYHYMKGPFKLSEKPVFAIYDDPEKVRNLANDFGFPGLGQFTHANNKARISLYLDKNFPRLIEETISEWKGTRRVPETDIFIEGMPDTRVISKEAILRAYDLFLATDIAFGLRQRPFLRDLDFLDTRSSLYARLMNEGLQTGEITFFQIEKDLETDVFIDTLEQAMRLPKLNPDWNSLAETLWSRRKDWAYCNLMSARPVSKVWPRLYSRFHKSNRIPFNDFIRKEILADIQSGHREGLKDLTNPYARNSLKSPEWISVSSLEAALGAQSSTPSQSIPNNDQALIDGLAYRKGIENPKQKFADFQILVKKTFSTTNFETVDQEIVWKELYRLTDEIEKAPIPFLTRLALSELISESSVSILVKRQWIHRLLVEVTPRRPGDISPMIAPFEYSYWDAESEVLQNVFRKLFASGALISTRDYWRAVGKQMLFQYQINGRLWNRFLDSEAYRVHASFRTLKPFAEAELDQLAEKSEPLLRKAVYEYTQLLGLGFSISEGVPAAMRKASSGSYLNQRFAHTQSEQYVDKLIRKFDSTRPSFAQSKDFFLFLTRFAIGARTDQYLLEIMKRYSVIPSNEFIKLVLSKQRIESVQLQIKLAEPFVNRQKTAESKALMIKRTIPRPSLERDKFLQEQLWRLKPYLSDQANLQKTLGNLESGFDWRKVDPKTLNLYNMLFVMTKKMSVSEKLDLIDHLISRNTEFPPSVKRRIHMDFLETLMGPASALKVSAELTLGQADRMTNNLIFEIQNLCQSMSVFERAIILQMLIQPIDGRPLSQTDLWIQAKSRVLKLKKGGLEEIMLDTFLEVIPPVEVEPSAGYMLARAAEKGQSNRLLGIFEIFSSFGIKIAQLSSLLNVFGATDSAELAKAKDSAPPEDLLVMINELNRSPILRGQKIRFVKMLGGASIKTAALVRLADGQEVVLMYKRRNASKTIQTHAQIGVKYVQFLLSKKVSGIGPLFEGIVSAMQPIMAEEVDLGLERQKMNEIAQLAKEYNRENPSGHQIHVPQVLTQLGANDDYYFLSYEEGITFANRSLTKTIGSPIAEKQISRTVVDFSLWLFFKHGYFEPDRHRGNFLLSKTTNNGRPAIIFIDPGQLIKFPISRNPMNSDIRLGIGYLLSGISQQSPEKILRAARALSQNQETQITQSHLNDLDKVLKAAQGGSDMTMKILDFLYAKGFQFDWKITFGLIKGLLILAKESYVSENEFAEMIESKARRLYLAKAPVVASAAIKQFF
jgi:predicted unusual protein kinase regulating ubiquinone biosynthesis (AarF/ABC1/UbiB family)